MSGTAKDFYEILGVSEKASQDEIKSAYRTLAKKYHPDANSGDEAAAERFKEIGEAYGVLSNAEKRKKYDDMRRFGAFDFRGGTPGQSPGGGGFGGQGPAGGFSFDDLGGLGDIFSSIFDRASRRGEGGTSGRSPRRGADVEYLVDISFKTAARGGKISISVPITEECATCGGSGARPGTSLKKCGECSGSGTVSFGQGGFAVNRPCPACLGRGRIPESPCPSCAGRGTVRQQRKLQVTVPAATDDGSKLRLSGQGERGTLGGEPGDLILTFRVRPDRFFRREGLDVHVTVPINLAQATLGSKVRVRTVDGKHVVLKIPAGTQTGTKFRIKGRGVSKGDRRGDQYVEVKITVPSSLTEEGRDRMESFAEAAKLKH